MDQRAIIIERPSGPFLSGLWVASGIIRNTGGSTHLALFDNLPVKSILYAGGEKVVTSDGSLPVVVFGSVTEGTKGSSKKVTYTLPAGSTLQYLIIGSQTDEVNALDISTDTVINPTI